MYRDSFILFFLAGSLWLSCAMAETYRWVDENGVTVYSQTPPPGATPADLIKAPPPPARSEKDAWQDLDRQWQELQDREDAEKERHIQREADEKLQSGLDANCQAAKHNLEILESHNRKLIKTPDGEYHRLLPEERQEHIEEARKAMEESCK